MLMSVHEHYYIVSSVRIHLYVCMYITTIFFLYFITYVHILLESGNNCVIHRMVYNAGTEKGSSGGAILMEKDHKLVIAGLHRGCEKIDLEQKGGNQEYNYGSLFSEISESVTNNEWHLKLSGD